jgi:hypothetical protein
MMYQESFIQSEAERLGQIIAGMQHTSVNGQDVVYITPEEFTDIRREFPPQVYSPMQRAARDDKNSIKGAIFKIGATFVCDKRMAA